MITPEQLRSLIERRNQIGPYESPQSSDEIERSYWDYLQHQLPEHQNALTRLEYIEKLYPELGSVTTWRAPTILTGDYIDTVYAEALRERALHTLEDRREFTTTFDVATGMQIVCGLFRLAGNTDMRNFEATFLEALLRSPANYSVEERALAFKEARNLSRKISLMIDNDRSDFKGLSVFDSSIQLLASYHNLPGMLDIQSPKVILAGVNIARRVFVDNYMLALGVVNTRR